MPSRNAPCQQSSSRVGGSMHLLSWNYRLCRVAANGLMTTCERRKASCPRMMGVSTRATTWHVMTVAQVVLNCLAPVRDLAESPRHALTFSKFQRRCGRSLLLHPDATCSRRTTRRQRCACWRHTAGTPTCSPSANPGRIFTHSWQRTCTVLL